MTIEVGMPMPEATLLKRHGDGFDAVRLGPYLAGRRVVIFGLPGAFTSDCSSVHLPSFIATADGFKDKGYDELICVAVNDPFVLNAWGDATGATDAGITMLADADASLTKALGMTFSAPPVGLYDRSGRYAIAVEDGVITHASVDEPRVCDVSKGAHFLETLS